MLPIFWKQWTEILQTSTLGQFQRDQLRGVPSPIKTHPLEAAFYCGLLSITCFSNSAGIPVIQTVSSRSQKVKACFEYVV